MVSLEKMSALFGPHTKASWSENLFTLAADYGFDRVLYAIVRTKHHSMERAFVVSNYPPEWRTMYASENLHLLDPTVSHCVKSSLPMIWTPETFNSCQQQTFYEEACRFDLRFGISYPIHGHKGELGMISFVTDQAFHGIDKVPHMQIFGDMALIRDYAFESSLKFLNDECNNPEAPPLTPRELECLKWMAEGKTSWAISKILGCTETTVNFHLTNVKRKFDVCTRQQVAVKAISLGLIAPS